MKKNNKFPLIIALTVLSGTFCSPLSARNLKEVLQEIETNSAVLKAAQLETEAARMEYRSEAALADPEMGFNYLKELNTEVGMRHDFSLTQSFDFASLFGIRHRLAERQGLKADMEYDLQRNGVLLTAELLCIEQVFLGQWIEETETHLSEAELLQLATERKAELGEATLTETGKARLHHASVEVELSDALRKLQSVKLQLKALNGGEDPLFNPDSYQMPELPEDFDIWYHGQSAKSTTMRLAEHSVKINQDQLSIDRASWLPSLNVGYMSEMGISDQYRGLTMGLSVPLWRNLRQSKQDARLVEAGKTRLDAVETELYHAMLEEYNNALSYLELYRKSLEVLEKTDSRSHLQKARELGELSILDYLMESDFYYDALKTCIDAGQAYCESVARLNYLAK